uniref:SWIM-type domain-containing protein n=1 Tax=Phytophthora ramorum TaxID=164328 RepID=H3GDV3_PHYRM
MCLFHVAKKIYEKTRVLDAGVAAMVLRHLHELHFARSEAEFRQQLEEVQEVWLKLPELTSFVSYFNTVWLNERTWRWQCYHTPSGFAATNNPVETYNASIKRDVTLRRKLMVGALLDRLLILCRGESVRARAFLDEPAHSDRLVRRTNALARDGLLHECRPDRNSVSFLLGNTTSEAANSIVNVVAVPCARVFDVHERRSNENLPVTAQLGVETARMEVLGMPSTGWEVDVEAQTCPCRVFFKQGSCVHLLYALGNAGGIDASGRETLVYSGPTKRKRTRRVQNAGRPAFNGPALALE